METDARFHVELLKLLLQVAWADMKVGEQEAHLLRDLAKLLSLPLDELAKLEAAVSGGTPLPPPDIGILRERRTEVIAAVHRLAAADGRIGKAEGEVIAEVEALLGSGS